MDPCLRFFPIERLFKEPVRLGQRWTSSRQALVLRLDDPEGRRHFGEICPLEGYSQESLSEAQIQTAELCQAFQFKKLIDPTVLNRSFEEYIRSIIGDLPFPLYPSVRCGLEALLWSFKQSPLVTTKALDRINIAGLLLLSGLYHNPTKLKEVLKDFRQQNIQNLKVKVSHDRLEQELPLLLNCLEEIRFRPLLRLDFNHPLSPRDLSKLQTYWTALNGYYLEDGPPGLAQMPAALDLRAEHLRHSSLPPGYLYFVAKPQIVGGYSGIKAIRDQCANGPILSSAFESLFSLTRYAEWAIDLGLAKLAHGLGTARFNQQEDWFLN